MSLLCFKTNSSSAPDAVIAIGTEGARVVGELAQAGRAGSGELAEADRAGSVPILDLG